MTIGTGLVGVSGYGTLSDPQNETRHVSLSTPCSIASRRRRERERERVCVCVWVWVWVWV